MRLAGLAESAKQEREDSRSGNLGIKGHTDRKSNQVSKLANQQHVAVA